MDCSEAELNGAAIKALGSLFKLTQVFLCDEGSINLRYDHSAQQHFVVNDTESKDFSPPPEDMELVSQMNELGLPLSFLTNKEKRNTGTKGKRKGTQVRNSNSHKDFGCEAMELIQVSLDEFVPPIVHDSNSSLLGQGEVCNDDIPVGAGGLQCPLGEGEEPPSSARITSNADTIDGFYLNSSKPCEFEGIVSINENLNAADLSVTDARVDDEKEEHFTLIRNVCFKGSSTLQDYEDVGYICNDFEIESAFRNSLYEDSSSCKVNDHNTTKFSECNGESGDWMAYWDDDYTRNYFYNVKTHVSTWFPPPGMEHLVLGDITCKLTGETAEVPGVDIEPTTNSTDICSVENVTNSLNESEIVDEFMGLDEISEEIKPLSAEVISAMSNPTLIGSPEHFPKEINEDGSCESEHENCGSLNHIMTRSVSEGSDMILASDNWDVRNCSKKKKKKKKARKRRLSRKQTVNLEEFEPQGIYDGSADMRKYWCQRYLLFSRYDDGIMMDEEGWFSVTPEPIARHHALRCGSGVVIDCFTGVGGNAIQFAKISKHVIAIDIDPRKVDYACHNAAIYGVRECIDFIVGDSIKLTPKLKADMVFLSPPWGGPDYAKVKSYDLKTMLRPRDGYFIFDVARKIASKVVMFLPRNVDINQLAEVAISAQPPWSLEVEKNFLNGKLKAVTAYFTDNLMRDGQQASTP